MDELSRLDKRWRKMDMVRVVLIILLIGLSIV
jgi:hypothetical protein